MNILVFIKNKYSALHGVMFEMTISMRHATSTKIYTIIFAGENVRLRVFSRLLAI